MEARATWPRETPLAVGAVAAIVRPASGANRSRRVSPVWKLAGDVHMRWQELLGLSLIASTLFHMGCGMSHADLAGPDPALRASRDQEGEGVSRARAQK